MMVAPRATMKQPTVNLVDHADTPNELSDAVLETLIIMAYEAEVSMKERINI